jgi:hypothetical protein
MDSSLDLSTVHGITVTCFEVCGRVDALDRSIIILFDTCILDDISAHKTNLAVGFKTEELRRGYLCEIIRIDVYLTSHRDVSSAKLLFLGMVGQRDHFLFILRVVVNYNLNRLCYCHAAKRIFIEIISNTSLKLTHVNSMICICNTRLTNKVKECLGGISAAAQTAKGGQTGIVPTVNVTLLNELTQITLGHNGVGYVHTSELPLMRLLLKSYLIHYPIVEGTVVTELAGAKGMGNTLKRVLNGMRKVVHRIYAPFVALTVMVNMLDSINYGVTEIGIVAGGVYLRSESACAIRKFAVLHSLEEVEIFFNTTVAVG